MIDPREYTDRGLFVHLLVGNLPRRGWDRRRAIARRAAELVAIAAIVVVAGLVARDLVLIAWALSL